MIVGKIKALPTDHGVGSGSDSGVVIFQAPAGDHFLSNSFLKTSEAESFESASDVLPTPGRSLSLRVGTFFFRSLGRSGLFGGC